MITSAFLKREEIETSTVVLATQEGGVGAGHVAATEHDHGAGHERGVHAARPCGRQNMFALSWRTGSGAEDIKFPRSNSVKSSGEHSPKCNVSRFADKKLTLPVAISNYRW